MTTLVGVGLKIEGKKSEGIVEIEDLTIKGAKGDGLLASCGMKVIMRGCTVEECGGSGVWAYRADITCDDLQVIGCGRSGVFALTNATITLSGQGTSIQGNRTKGMSDSYGLHASSSSTILLVHPLTKEQISTDNRGGRNWGGDGVRNIKQIFRDAAHREAAREEAEKDFYVGRKCRCRWKSMRGAYYNCEILRRNEDGTYVVDYEDGDKDSSVEWQRLHKDPK